MLNIRLLPLLLPAMASFAAAAEPVWKFDGQFRARVESREQTTTFNRGVSSVGDDSWLLTRARIGVRGQLAPEWAVYAQLQDVREFWSDRSSVPFIGGSEGDDPVDLRQAYLERKSGDVIWRVGRQAVALGDERLVGPSEWSNFSRVFDAARVTFSKIGGGLDVFVSSVVQTQPGGKTGWRANHSSRDDLFAGVYGRFAPTPALKLEPYAFWRDSRKDVVYAAGAAGTARPYDIPQKIGTVGVRAVGGPADKLNGFDYDADVAWQTGEARGRQLVGAAFAYPGPRWLDHRAWALHAGVGYSTKLGALPLRFYFEHNRATGDRDPADGRTESFLNLFPTNHKFYGGIDAFAWKNMREFAVTASTAAGAFKLRIEHHWFALESVNDTWFRANATTMVRPLTAAARQAPRRAGGETDLVISRPLGKRATLEAGFSVFHAGAYLRATGGASEARFGYVQSILQW